jgi:hypothetical protein
MLESCRADAICAKEEIDVTCEQVFASRYEYSQAIQGAMSIDTRQAC